MATITAPIDEHYSGATALSLNAGDLAIICAFWEWNSEAADEVSSGTISVDSTPLSGYNQQIKVTDSSRGTYMVMAPYLATTTASIDITVSPTSGRIIRLQVVKIVPSPGARFFPDYFVDDANQARFLGAGSGTLSLTNRLGDFLVGMCSALSPSGTLTTSWDSPATELTDVKGTYNEFSTGWQSSEETNDTLVWTVNTEEYSGGVGIAVREIAAGQVICVEDG